MIVEEDLLRNSTHFMDERQLEKNYLQVLLLYELYSRFSRDIVFKGGTALKLFYGLDRFSEDLDFTYDGKENAAGIINAVDNTFRTIDSMYNIIKQKRRGTATSLDFEIKLAGPLYASRKTAQAIELNISMREKVLLPPVIREIVPSYLDLGPFFVYVMDINEILYEKIRAILTRKYIKARDIYDVSYIFRTQKVDFDVDIINKKLAYYGKTFSMAEFVKRLESIEEKLWKSEMSNLIREVSKYGSTRDYILLKIRGKH